MPRRLFLNRAREQVVHMTQINEAHVSSAAVVLLDGPMDGQRFKVPVLPPLGKVPDTLNLPLKQPAAASPFALYKRGSDEPVGGYFVYFFVECRGPEGEQVLYAPTSTDAVASEQTGVLDLTSQGAANS